MERVTYVHRVLLLGRNLESVFFVINLLHKHFKLLRSSQLFAILNSCLVGSHLIVIWLSVKFGEVFDKFVDLSPIQSGYLT